MKMNKKGSIFIVDILLALTIIAVSASLYLGQYVFIPHTAQMESTADDVILLLGENQISYYSAAAERMLSQDILSGRETTYGEHLLTLLYRSAHDCSNCTAHAQALIQDLLAPYLTSQYGIRISLDETRLFGSEQIPLTSRQVIRKRSIQYGVYETTLLGPSILTVEVFQQ